MAMLSNRDTTRFYASIYKPVDYTQVGHQRRRAGGVRHFRVH